jgi:LmbE family N-acetylglucosaminyl deacetylase
MIHLNLAGGSEQALEVLCLGCHADDIEIGCGGTLLQLIQQFPNCTFHWVVFTASGARQDEARQGAELFAGPTKLRRLILQTFPDGFMQFVGAEVKAVFEGLKTTINPQLIFTHQRKDAHQDHRLISELTWNTFRNHLILEYEIPKYDGDMGQPNVFVSLSDATCQRKVRNIMDAFPSQTSKRWFEESTFRSLMRLRGMECNSPSGYAEAFYCRKLVI